MQEQLNQIDAVIDQLDQMILDLPIDPTVRQQLTQQLYQIWTELEVAVEIKNSL